MIAEEDTCAICDDPVSTTSNQIIYCDGKDCNMPVHQRCYGVAEIPEGDWLCQRCRAAKFKKRVVVICCPMQTGPLKRLSKDSNEYMHVTCATLNKDVNHLNGPYTLNRSALNQNTCCFCNTKQGLCVACGNQECSRYFHITCGINAGVITLRPSMPTNQSQFCVQHMPSDPVNGIKNTQPPPTPTITTPITKTVPVKRPLHEKQDSMFSFLGDSEDSDDAMSGARVSKGPKKLHVSRNDNGRDRPRPLNSHRPTSPSSKPPVPRQTTHVKKTYSSAIHPSITPSSSIPEANTKPSVSHPSSNDNLLLAEKKLEEANKEIKRLNQELERHENLRQKVAKIFMSLNISTTNGTFPTNENTEQYINIMHDTLERIGPPSNQEWSDIAKFSKALANRRSRHY
ncbi:hypothetical protein K492DRAFT_232877 [Lichtheimia hyalospora FSU 10163]|nr:hypothetical protein K492DRAFT_232877 [Lichtheimia hyalospora FSU 10163]